MSFRPLPLLGNAHVQTILGNFLTAARLGRRALRRLVALPDGDRIVLHESASPNVPSTAPIALIVHGLGGSHQSGYMLRMVQRLTGRGWRVVRMDLRGAGDGVRFARRLYNAGCSGDVRCVAEYLTAQFAHAPLAILGFSLGGNIVLKLAGELGQQPLPSVRAIAAMAPPVDLLLCSSLLERYPFYDAFYVRNLTSQVARHRLHFPDLPCPEFPRRMSLKQFDDIYTAPRWGYAGALDYYRQASSLPWLEAIQVPTFILAARDDPFIAVEPLEAVRGAPQLHVVISERGGHLGFLGLDGSGGVRWAETQLVHWLANHLEKVA